MAVETTTYRVETIYEVKNRASGALGEVERSARSAGAATQGLGTLLGTIGGIALGGYGIGLVKRSFIDFNSTVQETKSQIAGMLALASKTEFVDQLKNADRLFGNLQRRAAALPGTTQEYTTMAGMLAQPLVNAGMGMKTLEDLTVNTVVAAKALRVEAGAAARDVDQALRGQYHSVDVFTGKLLGSMGYAGETGRAKFNALSSSKRAIELQKAIMQPQIAEMAAAQGASFAGVKATMEDFVEQTLGRVGLPLFKAVSDELNEWTKWLALHKSKIEEIVQQVGQGLVKGFKMAKDAVSWIVDHSDILISIGKVWAVGKLASGAMGSLAGLGEGFRNSLMKESKIKGGKGETEWKMKTASDMSFGGLMQIGAVATASYMATTELMKLTGASDSLLSVIDPQRYQYEKLISSMKSWDDALAASRDKVAASGAKGAAASNSYVNATTTAALYRTQAEVLKDVQREIQERMKNGTQGAGPGAVGFLGKKLRSKLESAHFDDEQIQKYVMNPDATEAYRQSLLAKASRIESNSSKARNIADIWTDIITAPGTGNDSRASPFNLEPFTEAQKASIDRDQVTQKLMQVILSHLSSGGTLGQLSDDMYRTAYMAAKGTMVDDKLGQAKPNITNIKIDRVEVAAKDPDRWVADLDAAAKSHLKAPRSARGAVPKSW